MPYSHEQHRIDNGILMRLSHEEQTAGGIVLQNVFTELTFTEPESEEPIETGFYLPSPDEISLFGSGTVEGFHSPTPLTEVSVFIEHDGDAFIRRFSQIKKTRRKSPVGKKNNAIEPKSLIEDSVFFEHDGDTYIERVCQIGKQVVNNSGLRTVSGKLYEKEGHVEFVKKLNFSIYQSIQSLNTPPTGSVKSSEPEPPTGLYL